MHGMEVHTAIEHDLPMTFVVFNNNAHAMCVTREQLYLPGPLQLQPISAGPHRRGHGGACSRSMPRAVATKLAELTEALARPSPPAGPSFISVDCDPDEIPPFLPVPDPPIDQGDEHQ